MSPARQNPATNWIYWEIGLLASMWAIWSTPVEGFEYGGFAMVTVLFVWGLIRH